MIWLTCFFCNQFIVSKYKDAFYILPPYKTMCVIKVYIQHREVRLIYRGDHVAIQKLLLGTGFFSAPTIGSHRAYPLIFVNQNSKKENWPEAKPSKLSCVASLPQFFFQNLYLKRDNLLSTLNPLGKTVLPAHSNCQISAKQST